MLYLLFSCPSSTVQWTMHKKVAKVNEISTEDTQEFSSYTHQILYSMNTLLYCLGTLIAQAKLNYLKYRDCERR